MSYDNTGRDSVPESTGEVDRRTALKALAGSSLAWSGVGPVFAAGRGSDATGAASVSGSRSSQVDDGLAVTVRQVTRPSFPTIEVFATVRDAAGSAVTGLTADEMTISEDATEQDIESVTAPETDDRTAVSTSIVIDRSGSMNRGTRIEDAKAAAKQFVGAFDADVGDEAQITVFSTDTDTVQRWTSDVETLQDSIDDITAPVGGTALWDTMIGAIGPVTERVGRSAVVVLTDGQDNESNNLAVDARLQAEASGVPVYTIGLGNNVNESALQQLASETGGEYYRAPDSGDLTAIYERISQSISAEYRVTYDTSNTATDGTERTVTLSASDSGTTGRGTGTYVAPCAPIPDAAFAIQPSSPASGDEITVDGSPSSPNGGQITSYEWDFQNNGVTDATGQTATLTFGDPGEYEIRLTVEKGCGVTDVTTETIEVGDGSADEMHTVMITGNRPTEYTFVVDGTLEPATLSGSFAADPGEAGDNPSETDEGYLQVSNATGPAPQYISETTFLGDRYHFSGEVVELTVPETDGEVNLYLDEEPASRDEIRGLSGSGNEMHTVMITGNRPTEYTFVVDGTLEAATLAGSFSAEDNDTVEQTDDGRLRVSDGTGPAPEHVSETTFLGDRYHFSGEVAELTVPETEGEVNLYLDEDLASRDEIRSVG